MLPKDINNITEPVYKRLHKELEGKPQVVDVDNVNNLSDDVLNNLKAGDVIRKKTGNQYHSYRVSYKEDRQGICLTYCDASLVETISYDFIEGHWVYNSTDSTDIGNPPTGGTKLYRHNINLGTTTINIISPDSIPYTASDFIGTNSKMQTFRNKLILNNEIYTQNGMFEVKSLSVTYNGVNYYISYGVMKYVNNAYEYNGYNINSSFVSDTVIEL